MPSPSMDNVWKTLPQEIGRVVKNYLGQSETLEQGLDKEIKRIRKSYYREGDGSPEDGVDYAVELTRMAYIYEFLQFGVCNVLLLFQKFQKFE